MMHGNAITYKQNGNRHIKDLQMRVKGIDEPDNKWQYRIVYGFEMAKLMARTQSKNLGKWVATNGEFLKIQRKTIPSITTANNRQRIR
jgi:hypothetical protein